MLTFIQKRMLIERTDKEVIIRLSVSVDTGDLHNFLNFSWYKEITSKFKMPKKKLTSRLKR